MKCSSCGIGTLAPSYLEGLFACHTCDNCGGNLILLEDFLRWHEQHPDTQLLADAAVEEVAQETSKAMICPKTGGLMTKYKISADTEHRLDLSPTINAVWLDKGEWDLLKSKGLAHKLNNIFTDHWQHKITANAASEVLSGLYQRRFGDQYDEIKHFRARLIEMGDSPDCEISKSEVIAYLLADDPYAV